MPRKILIFGLPRTKTTLLQMQLSTVFDIDNLVEPYSNAGLRSAQSIYEWTSQQPQGVFKILTTNLLINPDLDLCHLIDCGFDNVILTDRKNYTNIPISLYYAERILKKYHHEVGDDIVRQQFTMDLDFLKKWCNELGLWKTVQRKLDDRGILYDQVVYEEYVPGRSIMVAGRTYNFDDSLTYFIDPAFDYQKMCINYQIVQDIVDEYLSKG